MNTFLLKDRPTVTVMVLARTRERVFELIERGNAGGADAFGIQIDQLLPSERTPELLKAYFAAMGKPVYATNYRWGLNEGTDEDTLAEGLLTAAECGASLIDVPADLFDPSKDQLTRNETAVNKQKALIEKIHAMGVPVLVSSHTFRFVDEGGVFSMLEAQAERGADVCKIVTSADSDAELAVNFSISARIAEKFQTPTLFLCNGSASKRHRLYAPLLSRSLFLCVAEHDEFSNPTQPLLSTARALVEQAFGKN